MHDQSEYSLGYSVQHLNKAITIFFSTVVGNFLAQTFIGSGAQASSMQSKERALTESQQTNNLLSVTQVGRLPIPDTINDIAIRDPYAFIATLTRGMQVIDISNTSQPIIISNYSGGFKVHDILIDNNFIYLAEDRAGLRILDGTNPLNPSPVGVYFTGWTVTELALLDNTLYLTDGLTGQIEMINISLPSQVFLAGHPIGYSGMGIFGNFGYFVRPGQFQIVSLANPAYPDSIISRTIPYAGGLSYGGIAATNSHLFVTGGLNMLIYSVNNISNPILVGNFTGLGTQLLSLTLVGNIVYLGNINSLQIVNVTNPTNPISIGMVSTNRPVFDITIDGSLAFLAERNSGIHIVDVTSPSAPIIRASSIPLSLNTIYHSIAVANQIAYLAHDAGLAVVNVSIPTNPRLLTNLPVGGGVGDVSVFGSNVYAVGQSLFVFDMSNPAAPILTNSYKLPDFGDNIVLQGFYAHIGSRYAGLYILDTRYPPTNLLPHTHYQADNQIQAIYSDNNHLFTLTSSFALTIQEPLTRAGMHLNISGTISDIIFSGSNALIANGDFLIVDVSQPFNPRLLSNLTIGAPATIAMNGQIIFLGTTSNLQIIDISNIYSPRRLSTYGSYYISSISFSNNLLFVAIGNSGLVILDVTNVNTPIMVGNYTTQGAFDVICNNNTLYIADYQTGLKILDVSNPTIPRLLSQYDPGTNLFTIFLSGRSLYLAADTGGLQILDTFNPANPIIRGSFAVPYARDVVVSDNLAFVSSYTTDVGFYVIDVSDAQHPFLRGIYKNDPSSSGFALTIPLIRARGDFVYFSESSTRLPNSSIRLFKAPLWDSEQSIPAIPLTMSASNNTLYLIDNLNTLRLFEFSFGNNFSQLPLNYQIAHQAQAVSVIDDFLYIAEGIRGVEVIDIFNKLTPNKVLQLTNLTNAQCLTTNANQLYVGDLSQGLMIFSIQGRPQLVTNQLSITQGQRLSITATELLGRDTTVGSNPLNLMFIINNTTHGQFEFAAQPNITIRNFTQGSIRNNLIVFRHDGTFSPPYYEVSLSNGMQTSLPQSVTVTFISQPRLPILVRNQLTINQAQTLTLSTNDLNANSYNSSAILTFTINNVKNGVFQLTSDPGVFIAVFTQTQINNGQIQFRHQGSGLDKPSFETSVNDGIFTLSFANATINFHAAPLLTTNQLAISQGETIIFSSRELQAIDFSEANNSLLFIVTNIQHGYFTVNNIRQSGDTNLTQLSVISGQVQFTQDDSDQAPTYWVAVRNSRVQTTPVLTTASLSLYNALLSTPVIVGASVAGVIALSGFIGTGLWYRKHAQNKNSRQQHQFARYIRHHLKLRHVDNFDSTEGQQFISATQKLNQALLAQGINISASDVDKNELWKLAENIAICARKNITGALTFFKKSTISISQFEQAIPNIVQDVIRLRAGRNLTEDQDSAIEMSSV